MTQSSQQFVIWLEGKIATGKPGEKLPTSKELSEKFGLSTKWINTLCKPFIQKGELIREPGKGTRLPGHQPELDSNPIKINQDAAESLAETIRRSIWRGEYKQGDILPAIKLMRIQFHVASDTVKKAYQILIQEGLIVKLGQSFWVGQLKALTHPQQRKNVILYHSRMKDFGNAFKHDEFALAFQAMEREISRHGYKLHFHPIFELHNDLHVNIKGNSTLPYGLAFFDFDESQFEKIKPELIKSYHYLSNKNLPKPQILIDAKRGKNYPSKIPAHVLQRGNLSTQCARESARFIARKKPQSVALFLDRPTVEADEQRDGFWNFTRGVKIETELSHLIECDIKIVTTEKGLGKNWTVPFLNHTGENRFQGLISKYKKRDAKDFLSNVTLCNGLRQALRKFQSYEWWVFGNEKMAIRARNWCIKNQIATPKDKRIMSMENRPEFYHEGITCCEIDWDNAGYLMAHALINDFPVEKTSHGFIKTMPRIIERHTTG